MVHTSDVPHKAALPKGHRANRCKALELNEAYKLHHEILARANDVRKASKQQIQPGQRQLFNSDELQAKKDWLGELTGENQKALLKSFAELEAKGPFRNVAKAPDPAVLDILLRDFPNFSQVTRAIQKHLLLCRLGPEQLLKIPPILLDGPAGAGKTTYCSQVAKLIGIQFEQIDLSAGGASFSMVGLDSGYSSGHPGRVWESLQKKDMSVLWQLDEVDKCRKEGRDSGSQWLLALLEPATAQRFTDNATLLPINASWIFFMATSNDKDAIEAPLRSRFEIFDIQNPNGEQLLAIVKSIHRSILESEPWAQSFGASLDPAVIETLANLSPREIRRALIDAFASAASGGRRQILTTDIAIKPKAPEEIERRIGFV